MIERNGIKVYCGNYTDPVDMKVTIHRSMESSKTFSLEFSCCEYYDNGEESIKAAIEFFSGKLFFDNPVMNPIIIKYDGVQEHDLDPVTLLPSFHYKDLVGLADANTFNMGLQQYVVEAFKGIPLRYPVFEEFQKCADMEQDMDDEDGFSKSWVIPLDVSEEELNEWKTSRTKTWRKPTFIKSFLEYNCDIGYIIDTSFLSKTEIENIKENTSWEEV